MRTLYGIGVGPGDPEYMTIKAVRLIKECQTLILPGKTKEECYAYKIVKQIIPEIDEKKLICCPFPMIKDKEKLKEAHEQIFEMIWKELQEKDVAFLTIGDPAVYSTYNYIHERVEKRGKMAVMVSGVPSFCAVAARLGIPLGSNKEEIHIIPGSYEAALAVETEGTCIYMKSGKKLSQLIESLETKQDLEIYGVSNCGLENEKVFWNLAELKAGVEDSYLTIVITKRKKSVS